MRFSEKELIFIRNELHIWAEAYETDEQLLCRIQKAAFEIETDECNRLDELTHRGRMAAGLVTRLGSED